MHAVRKYGHLETMEAEGEPEKWRKKYRSCRQKFATSPELFQRTPDYVKLIEFLFPELRPFPALVRKSTVYM
jgi:hypothetical protein